MNRSFLPQKSNSFDGLSADLRAKLGPFQSAWGKPFTIISGYRSPSHNSNVGGAKGSQHMQGNAVDIDVSGLSEAERIRKIQMARSMGFGGVGVYPNSLHFDVGPTRTWGRDYTSGTIPEAYQNVLNGGGGGPRPPTLMQGAPTPSPTQQPDGDIAPPPAGSSPMGAGYRDQPPMKASQNAFSSSSGYRPATWTDPNTVRWSDGSTNAFGPGW